MPKLRLPNHKTVAEDELESWDHHDSTAPHIDQQRQLLELHREALDDSIQHENVDTVVHFELLGLLRCKLSEASEAYHFENHTDHRIEAVEADVDEQHAAIGSHDFVLLAHQHHRQHDIGEDGRDEAYAFAVMAKGPQVAAESRAYYERVFASRGGIHGIRSTSWQ